MFTEGIFRTRKVGDSGGHLVAPSTDHATALSNRRGILSSVGDIVSRYIRS